MGLTGRQLIYIGIGIVPGTAAFLYANALDMESRVTFALLFAVPIWLCGFIKIYGNIYLDEFVMNLLAGPLVRPAKRLYRPEGPLDYLTVKEKKTEEKKKKRKKDISGKYEALITKPKRGIR